MTGVLYCCGGQWGYLCGCGGELWGGNSWCTSCCSRGIRSCGRQVFFSQQASARASLPGRQVAAVVQQSEAAGGGANGLRLGCGRTQRKSWRCGWNEACNHSVGGPGSQLEMGWTCCQERSSWMTGAAGSKGWSHMMRLYRGFLCFACPRLLPVGSWTDLHERVQQMTAGPFDWYRNHDDTAPTGPRLQTETWDRDPPPSCLCSPDDAPALLVAQKRAPPGVPRLRSAVAAAGGCSPARGWVQETRGSNQRAGTQYPRIPCCHHSGDPLIFVGRAAAALSCQGVSESPGGERQLQTATSKVTENIKELQPRRKNIEQIEHVLLSLQQKVDKPKKCGWQQDWLYLIFVVLRQTWETHLNISRTV